MLRYLGPEDLYEALPIGAAIEAMAEVFGAAAAGEASAPDRTVIRQSLDAGRESLMFAMPASWGGRGYGAKISSFIGDNPAQGHPAVQGVAVLLEPTTGAPCLITDAAALTNLRTAAMVGLATRYLARQDSGVLGIVGTGALASDMVAAVRRVRPIERLLAYNRSPEPAVRLVKSVDLDGRVCDSPEEAARRADVLVLATSSMRPVVAPAAIRDGVHINAVGNFSPTGGELDPETVARSDIWVDGYEGALSEAGDILVPASLGLIPGGRAGLRGDLAELVSGAAPRRSSAGQITLFKSVGTALADLGALQAAWESAARHGLGTPLS